MDTSVEVVAMDALGRRSGPRRLRTIEEKRQIAAQGPPSRWWRRRTE